MWKCILFSLIKLGLILPVLLIILYANFSITFPKNTDVIKCPFCYGESLCDAFANVSLKKTASAAILNLLNTKNVFHANFNSEEVVLKKLGSDGELQELDERICAQHNVSGGCDLSKLPDALFDYKNKLRELLSGSETFKSFKLCSENSAKVMVDHFLKLKANDTKENDFIVNLWTTVQINVEPLILQLLKSDENWPVPKYYGSCGRFIVEEYCGAPLTYKAGLNWADRARLALQLLQSAEAFTSNHPHFRFYLTDLSSDNIVVDDDLKLTYVDLENVLVAHKDETGVGAFHQSVVLQEEGFAYSEESVCNSALSDHNYFAVCKLLLSKTAEWPMMNKGLLHSPPDWVVNEFEELFELIEKCAAPSEGMDRITASKNIINILNSILVKAGTNALNYKDQTEVRVDL